MECCINSCVFINTVDIIGDHCIFNQIDKGVVTNFKTFRRIGSRS